MPDVIMPKMGDAMEEGTLLQWHKAEGAAVKAGDIIAEIETDKSNVEIEAEDDGVLHIQAQPGAVVPIGQVIATIGGEEPTPARLGSPPLPKREGNSDRSPASMTPSPSVSGGVPRSEERAKGGGGFPATNGQTANRLKASPLARRVAREKGLEIAQIKGTGPQGRIIEADVLAFAQTSPAPPELGAGGRSVPPTTAPTTAPTASTVAPTELSAMRKVIARRMVESKTTIPHFYITAEVDMAEAMALREKLNSYDETLPKISFNDMIVKASAKALLKVLGANAAFKDDKIYPGAGVHVGIAVALDDGLIVPVVRDADQMPLRKLAQTSKDLIGKARGKKLQPSEYSGGTFTVSNLGSFDVENFLAIIDPAQGAILAVSSISKKAVVLDDDTIVVRPRMNVTFSGDHRVMDGAVGAKFLQELKRFLQNPLSLLE